MTAPDSPRYPQGRLPSDDVPVHMLQRREPGKFASLMLAVIVHVAFFALIIVGVAWQVKPSAPISAELWESLPPARTAPPAVEPKPTPPPAEEQKPEPPPVKAPPPEVQKAPPAPPAPPQPSKADIELKAKREREEREKIEKKQREEKELAEKKKREDAKKEEDKKKADADKQRREQEMRQRAIDEKFKQEQQAAAVREQQAAAAREAQVAAARKAAIESYADKVRELIRKRANIPDTVTGKPIIQIRLRLLVNGVIFDAQVVKPSGNRVYDEAVERAINGIQQWPLPDNPELLGASRSLTLNIEHER
jgi:colicin import membrane protein